MAISPVQRRFLEGVLGSDVAKALCRSVREPLLKAVVPRVAAAWVLLGPAVQSVPGLEKSLELRKAGGPHGWRASLSTGATDVSPVRAISEVLRALGVEAGFAKALPPQAARRLGKAIDSLVASKLRMAESPGPPASPREAVSAAPLKPPTAPVGGKKRASKRQAGAQVPGITAPVLSPGGSGHGR